jgi:hypothetical protein
VHAGCRWGNTSDRDHLEGSGVDGRIILKCTFDKRDGGMGLVHLAQGRASWRAFFNAIMNLRAPQNY